MLNFTVKCILFRKRLFDFCLKFSPNLSLFHLIHLIFTQNKRRQSLNNLPTDPKTLKIEQHCRLKNIETQKTLRPKNVEQHCRMNVHLYPAFDRRQWCSHIVSIVTASVYVKCCRFL